jgi:hypothetical protein
MVMSGASRAGRPTSGAPTGGAQEVRKIEAPTVQHRASRARKPNQRLTFLGIDINRRKVVVGASAGLVALLVGLGAAAETGLLSGRTKWVTGDPPVSVQAGSRCVDSVVALRTDIEKSGGGMTFDRLLEYLKDQGDNQVAAFLASPVTVPFPEKQADRLINETRGKPGDGDSARIGFRTIGTLEICKAYRAAESAALSDPVAARQLANLNDSYRTMVATLMRACGLPVEEAFKARDGWMAQRESGSLGIPKAISKRKANVLLEQLRDGTFTAHFEQAGLHPAIAALGSALIGTELRSLALGGPMTATPKVFG